MRVFRLTKLKYSAALDGKGAAKSGNRWNSKGTEIIYTSASRALAMAEVAVHLTLATLPSGYVMMEIEIPEDLLIKHLDLNDIGDDWKNHPPNTSTQKTGDKFIDDFEYCMLKVPSAVVPGDFNYLINPHHKDFNRISLSGITEFPFDIRLFT